MTFAIVALTAVVFASLTATAQAPHVGGDASALAPPRAHVERPRTFGANEGAREEDAAGLATPTPAGTARAQHPPRPAEPRGEAPEEPWTGPNVELAYSHYTLSDAHGGGGVHAGQFSGYLNLGAVRLGAGAELGARDYSLAENDVDVVLRGAVLAGYQHLTDLEPFTPYLVGVGTLGVVLGKRFHTPVTQAFGGVGLEGGVDLHVGRGFFLGVGVGYLRVAMRSLAYDLLVLRVRLGL